MVEGCKQVSKVTLGTEIKKQTNKATVEVRRKSVTSVQVLVPLNARCCVNRDSEDGEEKARKISLPTYPAFGVPWNQHFHIGGRR